MIRSDAHLIPTELGSYRFKVWLQVAPDGAGVAGQATGTLQIWRSLAGETPGTDISGLVTMVEVDNTNMIGLYEITLDSTSLAEGTAAQPNRGSCALRFTNDGGPAFEDLAVTFLLLPHQTTAGVW